MNQTKPQPSPLDGKSLAIATLSVTACVLFVGYLLLALTPRSALAIGMNDRGGDYIMVTQQISSTEEAVAIIDAATKRMNLYLLDINGPRLQLLQNNIPLDQLPAPKGRERP